MRYLVFVVARTLQTILELLRAGYCFDFQIDEQWGISRQLSIEACQPDAVFKGIKNIIPRAQRDFHKSV